MAIADERKRKKKKKKKKGWLPKKGDSAKVVFDKLITLFAMAVLIVCIYIVYDYFKASYDAKNLNETLAGLYNSIIHTVDDDSSGSNGHGSSGNSGNSGKLLPAAKKLLDMNPDTVGWISVSGTSIDLPVVLHREDTPGNYYYIDHNFNCDKAEAGTIFADFRTTIEPNEQSDNVVLYGHDQKDGTMFGELDKYKKNLEFYKQNPVITFNTNYEKGQYKIIAFFVTNVLPEQSRDGVVFDYQNYIDFDRERYEDFIYNVNLRSQIITDVDTQFGDHFVTLSTCSTEFEPSRFVVIARKVRPGESADVDTEKAVYNENAMEPDWDVIYG